MSLTELESVATAFHSPEHRDRVFISFAEAANLSHGPHDSPDQMRQRIAVAEQLETIMQVGTPVLHQVNRLYVRGGSLLAPPAVVLRPYGNTYVLALSFDLAGQETTTHQEMYVRDLVDGIRYGAQQHVPRVFAGEEEVARHVLDTFYKQRSAERQPGGIPWDDISPLTELYTYGALAETNVRLSDIVPHEAEALRLRLQGDLDNPNYAHLAATIRQALCGLDFEPH